MARWYALDPDFAIVTEPMPALAPADRAVIDAIWDEQKRLRGDTLFDGPMWLVAEHSRRRLLLRRASYRYAVARRFDPPLGKRLGISPAGASGLVLTPDGLVMGKRGPTMMVPGLWEAAPAGSLAEPDPAALVLAELHEELGLTPGQVAAPMAVGLAEDTNSGVFDIVFRLDCRLSGATIVETWRALENDEYSELAVVPPDELADFVETHPLVGVMKVILTNAGLLKA
jgi:8-oxo-dGTP pyrophosphatase MutT (NUDIX family)